MRPAWGSMRSSLAFDAGPLASHLQNLSWRFAWERLRLLALVFGLNLPASMVWANDIIGRGSTSATVSLSACRLDGASRTVSGGRSAPHGDAAPCGHRKIGGWAKLTRRVSALRGNVRVRSSAGGKLCCRMK